MKKYFNEKLLIIAPHPDDEVIGCGGLIQRVKEDGGRVFVLFLTVGDTKDFSKKALSTVQERKQEIAEVANLMKFDKYVISYEGTKYHLRLDVIGQKELMHLIERTSPVSIQAIKPTIVAFPSLVSYNQDHQIAARATHASLRPSHNGKHFVRTVITYENPAERWRMTHDGEVNFFVHLKPSHVAGKIGAIKLYKSQLRPLPNPRTPQIIRALAKLRGAQSGSAYAEAYVGYRFVR